MQSFTCPYCGAKSMVDERFQGQSGTCATCAQPITIPVGGAPTPPAVSQRTNVGVVSALIVFVMVAGVAAIVSICWLLLPAVNVAQAVSQRHACGNNLKQIALAMAQYHDDHGSYPPAYVTNDKGKPLYSWRVLLLPYLGEEKVYKQFKLNEAWNSANNLALTSSMPEVYFCSENPDQAAFRAGETSYMVVVGTQTMFPPGQAVSMQEITDGTSNTIMVVETKTPGVNWMSPEDLHLDTMRMQINSGPQDPGSFHGEGGVNVVTADGAVHFLPQDTRGKALYNSLTKDGGEAAHLTALP